MIMKLISILFSSLLLAVTASAASAQNYYICHNGDDNNNGRSETTPFQSYEKAMATFNKMAAGDSILFCRGGVFPATTFNRLANSKCGPEKNCTIADYGDESKPAPMIVADGITALNFQNGGNSKPDGGYHIRNLTLISKQKAPAGIMLFNDVDDLLMENLHIEGFTVAVYSAGANAPEAGSNQANDRITLRNSKIINNKRQGWLGGCNDCVIDNNHFEGNGFGQAVRDHNVYIDSPVKSQNFYNSNIRFTNNTLLNSTRVDGRCQGASFVVHGIIKNLTVDSNIIREEAGKVSDNCWGIAVDPGNQLDESFVGLTITNNKLFNLGNLGIGCASCKDVLIEDNLIVDEAAVLRYAIAVPNKPEDSQKSENVTIRNNTIVANHDLAYGISLGGINRIEAINNEVSLSSTDSRAKCINREDGNLKTDVSSNICNTHESVSIIDVPVVEEPTKIVAEEVMIDEGEILLPLIRRPIDLANNVEVETDDASQTLLSSSRDIVSETTSSGSSSGATSGSSTSSTSSSETETETETEFETGVYSYVNAARTEPQNTIAPDTQVEVDPVISTDTTNETPITRGHSVSVNEVQNIIDNDISGVDESQCKVYARGRCMMM